jgi:hypothetical protein
MNMQGVDLGSFGGGFEHEGFAAGLTTIPKDRPFIPQSPPASPKQHNRDSSKNFLSNFKSKKVSDSEHKREDRDEYRPTTSSVSKIDHLRNNPGSTPELSLVGSQENIGKDSLEGEFPAPYLHTCEARLASSRVNCCPLVRTLGACGVVVNLAYNALPPPFIPAFLRRRHVNPRHVAPGLSHSLENL